MTKFIITYGVINGGEQLPQKKMGRPTNDPKTYRVDVRVGEDDWNLLEEESKKTGQNKPQIIRTLIRSLKK